ncbi:MAG: NAD(+)/NADH kinase [Clostridia bacterium]|nr:NAD(+)/NADH kinase [Clostridia bacterium]
MLGGDGTILNVATECAKRKIKIIGINYGHIGFLAEFEPEKTQEAVNLVLSGNYRLRQRTLLEMSCGDKTALALNDVVIQRNTGGVHFSNTVNLHAEINGTTVDNFSSDGIIISTPTGSTAYSLAAGGSVLTPDLNAFILTPVCPHSLHSRPVVFGDNSEIKVNAVNPHEPLVIIADGKNIGELNGGEVVAIKKSRFTADFISKEDKNFFNELLIKFNKWSK